VSRSGRNGRGHDGEAIGMRLAQLKPHSVPFSKKEGGLRELIHRLVARPMESVRRSGFASFNEARPG